MMIKGAPERILGIYEKAIRPQEWPAMFDDARRAGYGSFELSLDASEKRLARLEWSSRQIAEVYHAAHRSDIKMLTACFSGHRVYPLGSSDSRIQECALDMMQKGIDLCGGLGIRVLQVAGFDVYGETSTKTTRKRYRKNLERCVKMAEKACVMLSIEPVEINLLAIKDTLEVVKNISSPWLKIYPDVANINSLGIDPIEELGYGVGEITAVHIRDSLHNDFHATIPFGTGTLDFIGVFRKLDEIGYCGPLIAEMWNENNPDYFKMIADAYDYMVCCIRQAKERCGALKQ